MLVSPLVSRFTFILERFPAVERSDAGTNSSSLVFRNWSSSRALPSQVGPLGSQWLKRPLQPPRPALHLSGFAGSATRPNPREESLVAVLGHEPPAVQIQHSHHSVAPVFTKPFNLELSRCDLACRSAILRFDKFEPWNSNLETSSVSYLGKR
jgi:hypothetical protein